MQSSERHACLIMAHTNFSQLGQLIALLDDPRNDLYIHVDRKSAFDPAPFTTRYSRLEFIPRIRVNWGGYSMVDCELRLLEAALPGQYGYYHLLSGQDLPLKTQEEIHGFFRENAGKNFLDFFPSKTEYREFRNRIDTRHLLQEAVARNPGPFYTWLGRVEDRLNRLQRSLGLTREPLLPLYKGSNWFSITHEMAAYLVENRPLIRKQYRWSSCADELFVQSLAMASPFRDTLVNRDLRAIDWSRGDPYVYRLEDVPGLLAGDGLWGRKFDSTLDPAAVQAVAHALLPDRP